jgi:uncharacterized protein (TIGR03067 family)
MLSEPREAPRTSTYTLVAGDPAGIDLTTRYQGNPTPLETKAIYTLEGAALTYCVAAPGHPRPAAFATEKGDELTLVVLKRLTTVAP